jgi:hypothetical protein
MPDLTRSLTGGQELARKLEQRIDCVGRRYRDAQVRTADQDPAVIIINGSVAKIKSRCAYVVATIIKDEEEPTRQNCKSRIGTESGVQREHQGADIDDPTANPGKRRGHDIADALMGIRWQEARLAYRIDKAPWHRVGKAAKLHTGSRGELQVAASELLRNPAQLSKRRPGRLATGDPNPYYGTVLGQMGPQHPRAAVGASHARHRKLPVGLGSRGAADRPVLYL